METIAIALGPKPLLQGARRRLGRRPEPGPKGGWHHSGTFPPGRKSGGTFPPFRFGWHLHGSTFFSTFPEPPPGESDYRRPCLSSRTGVRDLGGGAAPPRRPRLAQTEGPDQRLVRRRLDPAPDLIEVLVDGLLQLADIDAAS